jgi:hypothetical protein
VDVAVDERREVVDVLPDREVDDHAHAPGDEVSEPRVLQWREQPSHVDLRQLDFHPAMVGGSTHRTGARGGATVHDRDQETVSGGAGVHDRGEGGQTAPSTSIASSFA